MGCVGLRIVGMRCGGVAAATGSPRAGVWVCYRSYRNYHHKMLRAGMGADGDRRRVVAAGGLHKLTCMAVRPVVVRPDRRCVAHRRVAGRPYEHT